MRWLLEVTFIGITSSWKWLLGSVAVVAALMGILFAVGVLGGGGGGETDSPRVAASPTPTPAPVSTPVSAIDSAPARTPSTIAAEPTATPAPQMISVSILATRAKNVGSLEFVLVFDPAKLEFAQLERGVLAGNALIDSSSPGPGRLWAGIVDVDGIDGSGSVAVVKFRVKAGAGGTMSLTLESIAAYDADSFVDIVTETTPGRFTVSSLAPLSPIVTFQ